MSKVNTGFEGRRRRSVWHHVIICLSINIHVSLRTRSRDVRAECVNHMLRRKRRGEEGSVLKDAKVSKQFELS